MCYFLCCCKRKNDEDKDNEINLFKLDQKSLEQLEKTEIEHTGRVLNSPTIGLLLKLSTSSVKVGTVVAHTPTLKLKLM